jgi:uncharacterized membrane protein
MIGWIFSPVAGVVLALLGAVFTPKIVAAIKGAGPAPNDRASAAPGFTPTDFVPNAEPDPDDVVSQLCVQVANLERRLAQVEQQLAQGQTSAPAVVLARQVQPDAAPVQTPSPVPKPSTVVAQPALVSAAHANATLPLAVPIPVTAPASAQVAATPITPPAAAAVVAPSPAVPPQPKPITPAVPRAVQPPAPPPLSFAERLPAPVRNFIFGGNTLVKVGVLLLFLGLAFLLRYAAERVSVPVPLRYTGVMLVGVVLLVIGWLLRHKRSSYALILQGAGIGVFYLTTLAAMKLHALIPPTAGFAFLFGVAVLSAVLAVLQNSMALAVVAALEGFAAPVLVSTGSNNPWGLFSYLSVLNVGIFVVAWFKAWRPLHLIGLTGTLTLAGAWAQTHYTPDYFAVTQGFLLLFWVMFSVIGLLFARRTLLESGDEPMASTSLAERASKTLQRVGRVDSALVFGTPLSAFGLQYLLVQDKPLGAALAAVGFGLFQLLLARLALAQRNAGLSLLAESYVVVAVLFGTLAIPLGLEGKWTGAAWAVEAAGMFWLGLRQNRPYARVFSLLVMIGASYKLLQEVTPSFEPGTPWLTGSTLGPLLLAGAAAAIGLLGRKLPPVAEESKPSRLAPLESLGLRAMPWLAGASLNLLPWMWLMPTLAPMGSTVLAVLFWLVGERLSQAATAKAAQKAPKTSPLGAVSAALHGAAVLGLFANLHFGNDQTVLANGQSALLCTLWVAAGLLFTVWRAVQLARSASGMAAAPVWTRGQQLAVLAATVLLHLAPLFVMSWDNVAWLWPLMGTLTLWAALRMGLMPLAGLAGVVQLAAVGVHGVRLLDLAGNVNQSALFMNREFLTSLVLVLAWLVSAGLLHAGARRQQPVSDASSAKLPGLANALVQWGPLVAGLLGWLGVWHNELRQAVLLWTHPDWLPGTDVLLLLASALLMRGVARLRAWPNMARASLAVLPALVLLALDDMSTTSGDFYLPSHGLGGLVWPLALLWHVWALRRWPLEASQGRVRQFSHVAGVWLFTALLALELIGRVRSSALADTAWFELSWVFVPAAVLYLMSASQALRRWPVQAFPSAYLELAALPLAAVSSLWLLGAGLLRSGNAAPLPYLPLLNPLELGLVGVTLTLLQWQRTLPDDSPWRLPQGLGPKLVAAVGLTLLTGMVLRACHHWAGVPWSANELFASRLTQAALSLTWALCAVIAMVLGDRRQSRTTWIAGATLLGVVVLKLFFVELADHGGIYRIVSFIGVGVLLLLVGYFAPVPGRKPDSAAQPASSD